MAHILHFYEGNRRLKNILSVLLLALFCLMPDLMLTAQITTAAISGNVSDGKDPISEAVVTVVHMPTGQHYYVFSNEKGNYIIKNILVGGPYIVRVERLNYKTAIIHDIEAPQGETVVVDAVLEHTTKRIMEVNIFGDGENSSMNINRSGIGIHLNSASIEMTPAECHHRVRGCLRRRQLPRFLCHRGRCLVQQLLRYRIQPAGRRHPDFPRRHRGGQREPHPVQCAP